MPSKTRKPEGGLPENANAERLVLGAILIGSVEFASVAGSLRVHDFSLEKHRRIFSAMHDLDARGESIDRITLAHALMDRQELDSVGGLSYIVSLDDGLPDVPHIDAYVRILKDKSALRNIIFTTDMLGREAMLGTESPAALVTLARQRFDEIAGVATGGDVISQIPSIWKYEIKATYLVEEILLEGAVTMWSGESGFGKSFLALALAGAVAQGQPFLGRAVKQRPVLYLDRENPLSVVKDRLLALGIAEIPDQLKIWGEWWEGHYPPAPDAACIVTFARRLKPLLIFDSLIAHANCDENSANEMRAHLKLYSRLAAVGATILVIHHKSDKGEAAYRGSSDIKGGVSSAWIVERDDGGGADLLTRMTLKPYKSRIGTCAPIRIQLAEGAFIPVDGPVRPALDIVKDLVGSHPGAAQKELIALASKQGLGERRLVDTLNEAVLAHSIDARRGNRKTLRYYLPEATLGGVQ